jgi:hypothetical protein
MPLYEMIMICRLGETQAIANLMKNIVVSVYQEGGVVRRFVNLGDRIARKEMRTKDQESHNLVRYISVEVDINPTSRLLTEKIARSHPETINVFCHKLNEKDYYKNIMDKESWKNILVEKDLDEYKEEFTDMLKEEFSQGNDVFDNKYASGKYVKKDLEQSKMI